MTDLEKMHADAGDLERYLRLQTYPLAIRLLRTESEIPAEAKRPKRDDGRQYNLCQAFALSRQERLHDRHAQGRHVLLRAGRRLRDGGAARRSS